MHLVLVSAQHHPSHGGIGAYIWELLHAAADAGWRVELLTRPSQQLLHAPVHAAHSIVTADRESGFAERIPVLRRIERIRPYRYGLWSLAVARKLLELDERPDVIECVDCQAEGLVACTSHEVRAKFPSTRFIISAHTPMWLHEQHNGADPLRFGRNIYHEWERHALAAADAVIAPSNLLLRRLDSVRHSIALPLPMRAIPPCSPAGNQLILLIGAAQPQKGVHVWARSLNRVLMSRPRATAALIGPDTPTAPDGLSMAAHVQRLIDPRCIDRFRWLGALPHEQVMRLVDDAALVVVPSAFESFSFAAAEAIMRGRPVIVSDQVGLAEHAPGLRTVPFNDADALADAQLEVLADAAASHEQARELRESLISACSPSQYIARRQAFTETVPISASAAPRVGPDTIETMEALLRDIDVAAGGAARAMERSGAESFVAA